MSKQYFLIVDTETTQTGMVADFGAIICDRKGRIYHQAAILVHGFYTDRQAHPLFHIGDADPLWSAAKLPERYARYDGMLESGQRMLASVHAINRWLERAIGAYRPILTAYNLAFDADKCSNTGIDLAGFTERFCLWHAAANKWAHTKTYKQFVLEHVAFNPPTQHGNMSYQTNAEVMARFLVGPDLPPEPHTAFEDARDYELPILRHLVGKTPKREYLNPPAYNWREFQVKNHYRPI